MNAYHFLHQDMTTDYGDEPPWERGEERTYKGDDIMLCNRGYHSSPTLWDALYYVTGPVACLVEISEPIASDGTEEVGDRKQVSKTRKLVQFQNIERKLALFAADCAERVLYIFEHGCPSDWRARYAIDVARRFADGGATRQEAAAARDAARAAAREQSGGDATRAAAVWTAAWAAAGAAGPVSWAATGDAAWTAARDAITATGGDRLAELQWQRDHFNQMFSGLFK